MNRGNTLEAVTLLERAGLTGTTAEIVDAFRDLFLRKSHATLFTWKERGLERTLSHDEFRRCVIAFKDKLCHSQLEPSSRVLLISESKPQWCIAFLAMGIAGHVVVPLDPKMTVDEVSRTIQHCSPTLILSSVDCYKMVEKAREQSGRSIPIQCIDGTSREDSLVLLKDSDGLHRYPMHEAKLDDTVLIAYTSGTSSAPKGVQLSYRNLWFQVISLAKTFRSQKRDVILSMLPLNHLLELTGGFLTALFTECQIVFASTYLPDEILECIRRYRVTQLVTVPLFLEQLQSRMLRRVANSGSLNRKVFALTLQNARHTCTSVRRRILFRKVHRALGGSLKRIICGGSALRKDTAEFFDGLGINVYQGYGLTETGPVISVNRPDRNRLGSVGPPLEAVKVRIEPIEGRDEGEVWVKGPNVMLGYWNAEQITREVISENGWFRTGDLGYLDADGYLWITGRIKNIAVLPGGKKVSLEEVEEVCAFLPDIAEACAIAVPHPSANGDQLILVVRTATNATTGIETIHDHFASLATFKRPGRIVTYTKDFPKTSTRKVQRQRLAALLIEEGSL